ncbi:heparan-alpha-glucosaminide N-acetyltransferase domain-containing protein [Georgenia sp. M64]|uniref:heparan-alpha-glucosaminide N-acetyltransferase domain-containing protein n=1 Tax=Georgenia sp. M64 TaxID=3120520 RepID=UPI0030E39378
MSPPADRLLPPRLAGIDVARGLAVLGMFVAHLGDDGPGGRHDPEWFVIADGRSSALFALLAGLSLALTSGRQVLPSGIPLIRARLAALVRAGVLLLLGVLLVALQTPVLVILPAYAVLFALAVPFLGLRRRWLVVGAVAVAVISPTVIFALTTPTAEGRPSVLARLTNQADPVQLPMDELVTGPYPALVFLAYVLLGMAVGRSDLSRTRTHTILVGAGTGLACLAWGTSRLAQDSLGTGATPLTLRLVSAAAHDNSTPEVIGNSGTSLTVIGLCLLITRPTARHGRALAGVLAPVAAT